MHQYFVNFQITVKWDLEVDASLEKVIDLTPPLQFGLESQMTSIELKNRKGYWEKTIDMKIGTASIKKLLQNPFIFQLNLFQKGFPCEDVIQIDGWPLLEQQRTKITLNMRPNGFKLLKTSIEIDRPIISNHYMRKFTPVFLNLVDIVNIPNMPLTFDQLSEMFAPVYFVCVIDAKKYIICPQPHQENHILDVVIPVSPREQKEVIFEIHDKENRIPTPDDFIGSGILPHTTKATGKSLPYGHCCFKLLPERKRTINFQMISVDGNVTNCNTQFHYSVSDPTGGASLSLSSSKDDFLVDGADNEPPKSTFLRWIFSFENESSSAEFLKELLNLIAETHSVLPPNSVKYSDAVRTTFDLITGFHLETPSEHLFVLETRATFPYKASMKLIDLISDAPDSVKVLADTNNIFEYPRLYTDLDKLFQVIKSPISLEELTSIHGLYFHKSPYSSLFSVINKFEGLMTAPSICLGNEMFPTKEELVSFQENGPILPSAPIKEELKVKRRFSDCIIPERYINSYSSKCKTDFGAERFKYASPRRVIHVGQHSTVFWGTKLLSTQIKKPLTPTKTLERRVKPKKISSTPKIEIRPPPPLSKTERPSRKYNSIVF